MGSSFGKRLRELRNLRGLTQEQLAELCNVSISSVSRWELDTLIPKTAHQIKLADVLSVSISDFYLTPDRKLPENLILAEILAGCEKLDSNEQQFVLKIIENLYDLNHPAVEV